MESMTDLSYKLRVVLETCFSTVKASGDTCQHSFWNCVHKEVKCDMISYTHTHTAYFIIYIIYEWSWWDLLQRLICVVCVVCKHYFPCLMRLKKMVVEIFSKCIHRQVHASLEQPLPVWGSYASHWHGNYVVVNRTVQCKNADNVEHLHHLFLHFWV